ncbi:hypothetical protein M0813_14557 [Anaeramoeba flamelloides]|uniref:DDE Tnp4 domain-containing protein n=1 Tax=Anaeramoeba flamelloides TaxID=1746091 RepID=A0ABQ8Z5J5_9EUKA|nr:hypothetical protein M0813_14557 [Anaeramoeba flamelloides]
MITRSESKNKKRERGRPKKYKRDIKMCKQLNHKYSEEWDRGVCYKCNDVLYRRKRRKKQEEERKNTPIINILQLGSIEPEICISLCGLNLKEFNKLHNLVKQPISEPRSTVSREVIHVIGVLNRKLENAIKWPNKKEIQIKIKKWGKLGWSNIVGALDITEHKRNRCTSFERLLYSGKQKAHTIKSIAVVDIDGLFLYFKTGYKGHLNDENVWNLDNLQQKLGPNNLLLTDGGFYGPLVTKPIRKPWINKDQFNDAKNYNTLHSRSRAVVECAFSVLKAWKIATHSNFLTPGNHILAIDTCAKLCNWTRRLYRVNKIQTTYEDKSIIKKYENFYRCPSPYLIKMKMIREGIISNNSIRLTKNHYIEFLHKRGVAVEKDDLKILKKLVQQYWCNSIDLYPLNNSTKKRVEEKILTSSDDSSNDILFLNDNCQEKINNNTTSSKSKENRSISKNTNNNKEPIVDLTYFEDSSNESESSEDNHLQNTQLKRLKKKNNVNTNDSEKLDIIQNDDQIIHILSNIKSGSVGRIRGRNNYFVLNINSKITSIDILNNIVSKIRKSMPLNVQLLKKSWFFRILMDNEYLSTSDVEQYCKFKGYRLFSQRSIISLDNIWIISNHTGDTLINNNTIQENQIIFNQIKNAILQSVPLLRHKLSTKFKAQKKISN